MTDSGGIRVLDAETGRVLARCVGDRSQVQTRASHLRLSRNGKLIASVHSDDYAGEKTWENKIHLWDAASGRLVRVIKGHEKDVNCIALSPDGKRLASASDDQTIRLWDVSTGKELTRVTCKSAAETVSFSRDGKKIVTGQSDYTDPTLSEGFEAQMLKGGSFMSRWMSLWESRHRSLEPTVRVWDATTMDELVTMTDLASSVGQIAISPDGTLVAVVGGPSKLGIWDARTGRCVRLMHGVEGDIHSLTFSPDGRRIATAEGSPSPCVRIWSSSTARELYRVSIPGARRVYGVSFSPEGRRLAVATEGAPCNIVVLPADEWQPHDIETGSERP